MFLLHMLRAIDLPHKCPKGVIEDRLESVESVDDAFGELSVEATEVAHADYDSALVGVEDLAGKLNVGLAAVLLEAKSLGAVLLEEVSKALLALAE